MPSTLQEKFASMGYNVRPQAPGSYRMPVSFSPAGAVPGFQGPPPSFSGIPGVQLTSTPTSAPAPGTGQDFSQRISEADVLRIATAVKNLMAEEVNNMVDAKVKTLVVCVQTLADENIKLHKKIDDLEMYSRKNCVRIFGVKEDKTDTDAAVKEIAEKLEVPLAEKDLVVSHRVGEKSDTKPRSIIARITNYETRHKLIKESRNLGDIEGFEQVSVNQELTKARAKVAYECRKIVKEGRAKVTFTWDGKIFIVDNNEEKHLVTAMDDLIRIDKHLVRKIVPAE